MMSKFLVKCTIFAVGIFLCVCLCAGVPQMRYHGLKDGLPVNLPAFPSIASLVGHMRKYAVDAHHLGTKYHSCAGVLVSTEWVLTGGRCGHLLKHSLGKDLFVSAGSTELNYKSGVDFDGYVESASEIVFYQDHTFPDFSMALFKLKTPFNESENLKPAKFSKALNYTFQNCRHTVNVFGFGPTIGNMVVLLQHAPLPMHHFEVCSNHTPSIGQMSDFALCIGAAFKIEHMDVTDLNYDNSTRESILCREDHGMPVFCKGFLIGFTNSLYKFPLDSANCTPANASSVFLFTDEVLTWIEDKSGVNVSYTTVSTSTTERMTTKVADHGPSGGVSSLPTREPILLLMVVYLCLYLI